MVDNSTVILQHTKHVYQVCKAREATISFQATISETFPIKIQFTLASSLKLSQAFLIKKSLNFNIS